MTISYSPAELDAASGGFGKVRTTMSRYRSEHSALRVPSRTFGHFPSISHQVEAAYTEHHNSCAAAIADAESVLGDFKQALADAASMYRQMNDFAEQQVVEVVAAL